MGSRRIVDVRDSARPREAGMTYTVGVPTAVALDAGYAVMANSDAGVLVYDVRVPPAPHSTGQCSAAGYGAASGV